MTILSPTEAAHIADKVYLVEDFGTDKFVREIKGKVPHFKSDTPSKFEVKKESRIEGTSGVSLLKCRTGFAVAAQGTGDLENEVLIACRGTASGYDLLTDLHISVSRSSSGELIHTGFNSTFRTIERRLREFFDRLPCYPHKVHCVGHSLGGALATLAAEWVLENKSESQPYLYTFGSPRVGVKSFADKLTQRVKSENIFRVCHSTDPISMVPLWPFTHVPNPGTECYINCGYNFIDKHHKMAHYIDSVSAYSDWNALRCAKPSPNFGEDIEKWLSSDSPVSLTINSISLINKALIYVLKKIMYVAGVAIQLTLTAGMSILDQLAIVLSKAVIIGEKIGGLVERLIIKILNAVGHTVSKVGSLTVNFIHWVLSRFTSAIYSIVRRTLDGVNRGF